jgi:hypothetical protein
MTPPQTQLIAAFLSISLLTAADANAALTTALGGQVVNDTDRNVTWIADANLAATNTFGVSAIGSDGRMNWITAQHWIGAMNTANYLGYSDWRLPTLTVTPGPFGEFADTGEMGHLFGELGGSPMGMQNAFNKGPFDNFQMSGYWFDKESTLITGDAYSFCFGIFNAPSYCLGYVGFSTPIPKDYPMYALAVRDGQVPVPVPMASWLLGSGLLGLVGVARRKTA